MKNQPDVYHAIAHPERRRILEHLMEGDSPAMDLSVKLSPSALSQHLRVLRGAGLVRETRSGRRRIYSLIPEPLEEAFRWLARYESFWKTKLGDLGDYLRENHEQENTQD